MHWKKITIWIAVLAAAAVLIAVIVARMQRWRPRNLTIQGAVVRSRPEPGKQSPIGGVTVTATDGMMTTTAKSDSSGYFQLRFRAKLWPGHVLQMEFRKPEFKDSNLTVPLTYRSSSDRLFIAALEPIVPEKDEVTGKKLTVVSNVRVRFTENVEGDDNIGSAVKTFQVVNKGNVPCNRQAPCSPDGRWK